MTKRHYAALFFAKIRVYWRIQGQFHTSPRLGDTFCQSLPPRCYNKQFIIIIHQNDMFKRP